MICPKYLKIFVYILAADFTKHSSRTVFAIIIA